MKIIFLFCFVNGDNLKNLCLNISKIKGIIKGVDFCCIIIHKISKYEADYLLQSSVLDDCGHI